MTTAGDHRFPDAPAVPPSLLAGDHGMRDYNSAGKDDTSRATPNTVQNITPYLGLRSRLSQVWINRWTILLFLVLVRVLIAVAGLNYDIASAKTEAMSACSSVEDMGSTMASMPHYLAAGVNELAASGVEKAVHGLMSMLTLTITGVEELIIFFVHIMTSTYLCLITLLVRGALHVALKVIEEAADFLNNTLRGISDDLGKAVGGFEKDFNKFTGALNSVPKIFGGGDGDIPKINLDKEQKALTELQLPSELDQGLNKINASIPTFDEVQHFVDDIIRIPFEEVKKLVQGSLKFSFNRSILSVPQKKDLNFCSGDNEISNFFDSLTDLANTGRKIFIAVLVVLAITVCIPMALRELRRFRLESSRAHLVKDNSFDPMDVIYIASRPHSSTVGIKAGSVFQSTKKQILVRWVIAYATSPPALFILTLGLTGLFSCLCQYALLRSLAHKAPGLAKDVGGFADKVVKSLNDTSEAWANDTNAAILQINDGINEDVFGWVNTSTNAVNKTLNGFVDQTTKVLNDTFGDTVLHDPVLELFNCLIGLKVAGVQKGLTWVSEHAKVNFPSLANDTFSIGAIESIRSHDGASSSQSFLAAPGAKTTDKITGAVNKVIRHFSDAISTEAIISSCILLLWLTVLLLGITRAIWLLLRGDKIRGEGGPAPSHGIQLQDRPNTMLNGPAPAYEPPRAIGLTTANPFHEHDNIVTSRRTSFEINDQEWQDEKVGYAGLRAPAEEGSITTTPRRSIYPIVEKS